MMGQKVINTNTLREWLEKGKKVNILDVRPDNEREEWYIPGSLHVNAYDKLKKHDPDALKTVDLDKTIPVVTVCGGGKTSKIASELMQKAGYEAYNLEGGMKSWNMAWNTATVTYDRFEMVQFRRTGKGCLSYMIVSGSEALIVDASLPVEVYQEVVAQKGLILKYVMDTHIHADHLSRSKILAETYDIKPSIPENDQLIFPYDPISDGRVFSIGEIIIKAIHTPGHTAESSCYLVDESVLLTGDTLFTNGVGRPDLKANKEEAEHKASQLYHSLRKIKALDKSIIVMPGHTSRPVAFDRQVIQSSLEVVTQHTLLLNEHENIFVQSLLKRIPSPPDNYLKIVEKNISGDMEGIDPVELEAGASRCAVS